MPVAIGFGVRQRFSRGIQPGDFDTSNGPAIDERTHECIRALIEEPEMHTEVADVEVSRLRVVTKTAGLSHNCDVNSRVFQFSDILNRNVSDASPVGLTFGCEA